MTNLLEPNEEETEVRAFELDGSTHYAPNSLTNCCLNATICPKCNAAMHCQRVADGYYYQCENIACKYVDL